MFIRFLGAAATASQDTIALKTWSEGLPDTNPWFELFSSPNYPVYPYTLRNNFGSSASSVAWRELILENEHLRCRVFPDLGGHLYSCLDKTNNVEMFYANPVIRKGNVGLRAAWVAIGIELNFPVGHSLVSVSPVSFGTKQNADGSAAAWVADIDRQTGMEWRVEFVLRPGVAMLEQNVWLYNRGDVRQPYCAVLAPQSNALIAYYRGYCRQQLGASPNADFSAPRTICSAFCT